MGNQITTAKTPNEILPVERYFSSLPGATLTYESSLGSTRFLKVAKARTNNSETRQQLVVKVFVIQDPSLSLKQYAQQADYISEQLSGVTNCLPYQYNVVTDKAGFLVRQYIKYNLYDRISTRPFLTPIEKKWIAFQLLSALSQCYNHKICHGDIKSENVMITSWNWVLLTDFANIKPTHLPENNPSDYNYFFDTSRRRTCYIAPERFQHSSTRGSELGLFDLLGGEEGPTVQAELTHAMDIFSLGCVLIELFSEGKVPFNLSQLLSYRMGDYSPWKVLDTISDRHVKELLTSMIQKNPSHRLSSEEYLLQQKGKAFPSYFYTFLKAHVQGYRSISVHSDDRISKVRKELPSIMRNTGVTKGQDGYYEPLVIILEIVTSSIRELKFCENKLNSLSLLLQFAEYLPADITLDRIIPHMMHLLEDAIPRVKAEAVRTVTLTLSNITCVPKNEANIFPDYILPAMNNLATHESVVVRVALAENMATLAETAVRFLNISQSAADSDSEGDYEAELNMLHDLVQTKVVSLLSDVDNSVKRAVLHFSITKLAVIFGKQKASDVILSHMITFLNDKQDWQLRAEFFQCVVGIASYIGWQSTTVLRPLIEQGLSDSEEFVIRKCLEALNSLLAMRLMEKTVIQKLLDHISPLLSHPNEWIRYGVAQCVSTIASVWSIADVHCNIMPTIKPYLAKPAQQINRLDVLLHCLHDPVPRPVLDFLIKSNRLEKFFSSLEDRQLERNITKAGHEPVYTPQEELVNQMSKKLYSLGLKEEYEDRLLRMRDFIMKLHSQFKAGVTTPEGLRPGTIDISMVKIQRRHADLLSKPEGSQARTPAKLKTAAGTEAMAPADVRLLFTGTDILDSPTSPPLPVQPVQPVTPAVLATPPKPEMRSLPHQQSVERLIDSRDRPRTPPNRTVRTSEQQQGAVKQAKCKLDLRTLVHHKRDEYAEDYRNKTHRIANVMVESFTVNPDWKPLGILVSHVHEHKDAVSRVLIHPSQQHFLTASKDGTLKIWDTYRPDQRLANISRSRSTHHMKEGGKIIDMAFCTSENWVACLTSNDCINLINIETADQTNPVYHPMGSHTTDTDTYGHIVALANTEYGPKTVINYGTVNGYIIGWDIRANRSIYTLKHSLTKGLISCMTSHTQEKWLAVGTAHGSLTLYDMRFQLPVNSIVHSTGLRVNRLHCHPTESSWVIASIAGNNEVSMWNLETKQRQRTLWASPTPLLSTKQCSKHWTNGLHVYHSQFKSFIVTGGTDMRIRYWDLNNASHCLIMSHAATDPKVNNTITSYKSKVVEGTDCIVETYEQPIRSSSHLYGERKGRDKPHPGHHDIITDISMYHTTSPFIVSASACGVVKVWK